MLTFSDDDQKKLHLKAGSLSSNVKPQPAGKPMLIYTRSAMLEVVGTQFEVEAETAATMLNVSEGSVRVTRFSDGNSVDVPARHRVIAAADKTSIGKASKSTERAGTLAATPTLADALGDGAITAGHVDAVLDAVRAL